MPRIKKALSVSTTANATPRRSILKPLNRCFGSGVFYLNDKDNNSISNFRKITGSGYSPLTPAQQMDYKEATSEYTRLSSEGNVHNVISQTVSILKQICKICDFALGYPDLYPNRDYYNELKENAELALILVKQNPIYDETDLCE